MKKIKKYWVLAIILVVALSFFAGTAWYNHCVHSYGNPDSRQPDFVKWSSPDETANYIFAKLYGHTGSLVVQEDYNLYVKDIMHPRSFRSDHGAMKPVSFLGLPVIYGWLAGLTDYSLIPFFTPFFGSLGIVIFYLLIKEWLDQRIAVLSSVFLAGFPVYIYYTARSMFHNVLFTVLLLAGFLFLVYAIKYQRPASGFWDKTVVKKNYLSWVSVALAGLAFGAALAARTSEAIWVGPLLLFVWLAYARKWGVFKPVMVFSFMFLALLPVFYYNQVLYGNFYFGGYAEMNASLLELGESGGELASRALAGSFSQAGELMAGIFEKIFYFGFHPRDSLAMFQTYFVQMFFWLFWAGLAGFGWYYARAFKRRKYDWLFLASFALVSAVLVFYYGSWNFHDNPDASQATIGNSYTRYWLPVYLAFMPMAAYLVARLSDLLAKFLPFISKRIGGSGRFGLRNGIISLSLMALAVGGYFYLSIPFVLHGSDEGLVYTAMRQKQSRNEWERILELTERNSVIITAYHDKLLFPERKVIVGLFDDKNMIELYREAAIRLPVYYYNFELPPQDIDYLNQRRLKESGLRIEKVKKISSDFTLYELNLINIDN